MFQYCERNGNSKFIAHRECGFRRKYLYRLIHHVNGNGSYFLYLVTVNRFILYYMCQPNSKPDSNGDLYGYGH